MADVAALAARLARAGCVAALEEAEELAAAAPDADTLESWARRRERGEPLEWIVGTARFCGLDLRLARGVYVPRPQTEGLARRAARLLPAGGRAADLCTGSGAIAAHLRASCPTAAVVGVDLDFRAARCACGNGIPSVVGDLTAPLRDRAFDVVTCVAPYVPTAGIAFLAADVRRFEPRRALDGGADGLDILRRVVAGAARALRPGGHLLVELGGNQDEVLQPTLLGSGFCALECWYDDEGDLRGLRGQLAA